MADKTFTAGLRFEFIDDGGSAKATEALGKIEKKASDMSASVGTAATRTAETIGKATSLVETLGNAISNAMGGKTAAPERLGAAMLTLAKGIFEAEQALKGIASGGANAARPIEALAEALTGVTAAAQEARVIIGSITPVMALEAGARNISTVRQGLKELEKGATDAAKSFEAMLAVQRQATGGLPAASAPYAGSPALAAIAAEEKARASVAAAYEKEAQRMIAASSAVRTAADIETQKLGAARNAVAMAYENEAARIIKASAASREAYDSAVAASVASSARAAEAARAKSNSVVSSIEAENRALMEQQLVRERALNEYYRGKNIPPNPQNYLVAPAGAQPPSPFVRPDLFPPGYVERLEAAGAATSRVTAATQSATSAVGGMQAAMVGLSGVAPGVSSELMQLSMLVSSGLTMAMAAAVTGAGALAVALLSVGKHGNEVNQMLENTQIHLAGLFMTFNDITDASGKMLQGTDKLNAAMRISSETQTRLQAAAFQTVVTYEELVKGFGILYAMGTTGGGTVNEVVRLSVTLANYAATQGRSFESMARQMAIVEGGVVRMTGNMGELMRSMGVDNKTIKSWREQGVTVAQLNKYFEGMNALTPLVEKSWKNVSTNIKLVNDLLGAAFEKPLFELAKSWANDMLAAFARVEDGVLVLNRNVKNSAEIVGQSAAGIATIVGNMAKSVFASLGTGLEESPVLLVLGTIATVALKGITLVRTYIGTIIDEIVMLSERGSAIILKGIAKLQALTNDTAGRAATLKAIESIESAIRNRAGSGDLQGPSLPGKNMDVGGPIDRFRLRMDKAFEEIKPYADEIARLAGGIGDVASANEKLGNRPLPPDKDSLERAEKALAVWEDFVKKTNAGFDPAGLSGYEKAVASIMTSYEKLNVEIEAHARTAEAAAKGSAAAIREEAKALEASNAAAAARRLDKEAEDRFKKVEEAKKKFEDALTKLKDQLDDQITVTPADRIQREYEKRTAEIDKQVGSVLDLSMAWAASYKELSGGAGVFAGFGVVLDDVATSALTTGAALRLLAGTQRDAKIEANNLVVAEHNAAEVEKARLRTIASAERSGNWDLLWSAISQGSAKTAKSVQDNFATMGQKILEFGRTASDGMLAAFYTIQSKIPTVAESVAGAVIGAWDSMARGFDDAFYSVISGRLDSLKDVFHSFTDSLLKTFSKMVTDMVLRWIAGQQQMKMGNMGVGDATWLEGGGFIPSKGYGSAGSSTLQGYAGAAGVGLAAGSAIGNIGNGQYNMAGAQIGGVAGALAAAAMGAKLGSVLGYVGAIVGAVVGLIVGTLMSPNTEQHVTGLIANMITGTTVKAWIPEIPAPGEGGHVRGPGDTGYGPGEGPGQWVTQLGPGPQNAVERAGSTVFETMYGWVSDLLQMGAKAKWPALAKAYQDRLIASLQGAKFDIAAGDVEDIQKTIQKLLTSVLPSMSLAAAFGQTGYLPSGNRDAKGGMGGFDWWTPEMDKDGNWIKKQLYDPQAPIPLMLTGLGFTQEKITEIAQRLTTDDPEKFKAYLQGLVKVVVTMDELIASMSMSGSDMVKKLATDATKSPKAQFADVAKDLSARFDELSLFSGDELVKRAQEVVTATQEAFNQLQQYLEKIRQTGEQLSKSITDQISNIEFNLMTPWERMNATKEKIGVAVGKIPGAQTPEEVAALANEAQAAIGQIIDTLFSRIARGKELITGLTEVQQKWATSTDPKKNPFTSFAEDSAKLQADIAAASKLSGDDQLDAIEKVKASAEDLWNRQQELLAEIASALSTIQKDVQGRLEAIDEAMRTPAQSLAFKQQTYSTALAGIGSAKTPAEVVELAQKAAEAVSGIVSALVQQIQRAETLKTSLSDITGKLAGGAASPQTFLSWFADAAKLQADAVAASKLAGTEQLDAIEKVNTAAVDLYQRQQQFLQQIAQMLDSLTTSIDDQIRGIDEALMSPAEKLWNSSNKAWAGRSGIANATDPAAVQKAVQDAQAAVGEIINALVARLQQGKALAESIAAVSKKFAQGEEYATPGIAYARDAAEMNRLVTEAATLSGQAQLDVIEKVKAAAEDLYQRQAQMISAIDSNVKSLGESIEKQKWDWQMSLLGPGDQVGSIQSRIESLMAQLPKAGSAEEVQRITGEVQSLTSQYVGMFDKNDPRRADAIAAASKQLDALQKIANEVYTRLRKQITDSNDAIRKGLETAGNLVESNMEDTANEIDKWRQFLVDIRGEMQQKLKGMGWDIEQAGISTSITLGVAVAGIQREIDATKNAIDKWREQLVKLLGNAEGKLDEFGKPLKDAGPIIAGALGTAVEALKTNVSLASTEIGNWKNLLGNLRSLVGNTLINMADAIALAFVGNKREGIRGLADAMNDAREKMTSAGTGAGDLGKATRDAAGDVDRFALALSNAETRINGMFGGGGSGGGSSTGNIIATSRAYYRSLRPRTA